MKRAQSKPRLPIGWINISTRQPNIRRVSTFHEGMAALGWKPGTHYITIPQSMSVRANKVIE